MRGFPTARSRRRAVAITVAGATVLGGAALLAPGTSTASSHRESPYLINDPAIDNTDVYAFTSPDKTDTATFVANFFPVQEPGGGPNFFPFATDARYNINIDNNGDAKPDVVYRWTFKDIDRRGTVDHGDRGKGSILYNDGPVTSLDDANLLFRQTYTLQIIANASTSSPIVNTLLADVPVPPNYVGDASIPDYVPLREAAVAAGRGRNGISAFAGQRDDPFFLDIRIFDLLYGGDLSERGFNSLAGKNVNTLAVQVPKVQLAGNLNVTSNPVIGVWSTSERQQTRVFKPTNAAPATSVNRSSDQVDPSGDFVQLSRLSTPLANEALIPSNLKDYFNRSTPDRDATVPAVLAKVQDPEIPHLIEGIYKIPNPNKTAAGRNRPDLVATFLTGISKKSYPAAGIDLNGQDLNANNVGVPSEMLRLNLTTPVTARPNRLGVVGGDVGGFPNGRRLTDDVVDIELQALEGILIPDQDAAVKKAVAGLGDAVDNNDKAFLPAFPYVADPHSGSDVPDDGKDKDGDNYFKDAGASYQQSGASRDGKATITITITSPAGRDGAAQVYLVNADGSQSSLGTVKLSSKGTTRVTKVVKAKAGSRVTLNSRMIPSGKGAASWTGKQDLTVR